MSVPQRVSAGRVTPGSLLLLVALTSGCLGCSLVPANVKVLSKDTTGLARGVDSQGLYAYVADGPKGLVVFNVSSANAVQQVGALDLPGFNDQVAVEGSLAVLTDASQALLYGVDVGDPKKPKLAWTHTLSGRASRVALDGGVAFLIVRDDAGAAPFKGLEAVQCSPSSSPKTVGKLALPEAVDLDASADSVFVAKPHGVMILKRTASTGFASAAVASLAIPKSDALQSLDSSDGHLVALGRDAYSIDVHQPSAPKLLDHTPVSGRMLERVIALSPPRDIFVGRIGNVTLFAPIQFRVLAVSYTTVAQYGAGIVVLPTGKFVNLTQYWDLAAGSKGHAKLYDIHSRDVFWSAVSGGGISRVGALDNNGLVYEAVASSP